MNASTKRRPRPKKERRHFTFRDEAVPGASREESREKALRTIARLAEAKT